MICNLIHFSNKTTHIQKLFFFFQFIQQKELFFITIKSFTITIMSIYEIFLKLIKFFFALKLLILIDIS